MNPFKFVAGYGILFFLLVLGVNLAIIAAIAYAIVWVVQNV